MRFSDAENIGTSSGEDGAAFNKPFRLVDGNV